MRVPYIFLTKQNDVYSNHTKTEVSGISIQYSTSNKANSTTTYKYLVMDLSLSQYPSWACLEGKLLTF